MAQSDVVTVRPFIAGDWCDGAGEQLVADKYTDRPATSVGLAGRGQIEQAVSAVAAAQEKIRLTQAERFDILARASALATERRGELIDTVVADTGFTVTDAAREVDRTAQTLLISAEEARRLAGEVVPLEGAPGQRHRLAFTTYHPVGVVCAITPFNSPLNTVAHKVAPALAAGNGIVLKPAEQTPRSADALLRLLLDAGLPAGLIAVIYGDGPGAGQQLLEDERIAFYAFTGSTSVGEHIHRVIGMRRSQLEMGSLSSTIICADADLRHATDLVVNAGFRKAGQVCTSVQRLYVERPAVDEVAALLSTALASRPVGDPHQSQTFVGPLISPADAQRVDSWIGEAVASGARVVTGGTRVGNVVNPTVLAEVDTGMKVMNSEIFGPVVVLRPFGDLDPAIDEVNATPYGLAAGIFTRDIGRALNAADRLRMGSVHINETSSSRVDLMPYSGVKASGHGTEGPRYAMREMSEQRLVTLGRP
jgi:acyl-CoA reductase-like NAD-dependent aldehyde dehydrogenase